MKSFDFTKPDLIHQFYLANGATLLIKNDRSVPVVSLNIWVEAGSIDERPNERGMAHLIEHMIFKGTEKRGVGEISRDVEAAGGYLNAFTSFEHTCFYVVLPSSKVLKALDIEFDAFLNSTFDAQELEKEKEVVFEEMKMRQDDPWSWSWELLFKSLFKKNPYHWPVIGNEKILKNVPRESLLRYYKTHYVPKNMVICIVGNISVEETEEWVRKHFSKISMPAPPSRHFKFDKEPIKLQFLDESGEVQQHYLSLGFPTVPIHHNDAAALEVLEAVLSDGGSSRLSLSIREKSRSADEVGADHFAGKYGGSFVFQGLTDHKRVRFFLKELMFEVGRVNREGVTFEELEKVKNKIKASKIFEKQSMDGQAKTLGYWQLQGDYRLEEKFLNALDIVSVDDIKRVCEKYVQPHRATLLIYHPKGEIIETSASYWQEVLESGLIKPRIVKTKLKKSTSKLQRYKLLNGSQLLVRERHDVPVVSLGVFLKGGFCDEDKGRFGLTSLMTKSLVKGTLKRSYEEYSKSVERLAAHIDPVMEKDFWGLTTESLTSQFPNAFSLMVETLLEPAFLKEEIDKEKNLQLAALKRLKDDPTEYALLRSDVMTFAGTVYAHPPQGISDTVSKLKVEDVMGWYRRFLNSSNMTWIMVGNFAPGKIKVMINEYFSNLPRVKKIKELGSKKIDETGSKNFREEVESRQTNIVLGFRAPAFRLPEYFSFRVLNTLLNGMGGRLFVQLREKNSLAYSVFAAHEALASGGIYQVYIGCAPEKEVAAKKGLEEVLTQLASGSITSDELERAKTYMIGLYQLGLQANRSQMSSLARYELSGPGANLFDSFPKYVKKVTVQQVQRAAKQYLKLSEASWVVVAPKKSNKRKDT